MQRELTEPRTSEAQCRRAQELGGFLTGIGIHFYSEARRRRRAGLFCSEAVASNETSGLVLMMELQRKDILSRLQRTEYRQT